MHRLTTLSKSNSSQIMHSGTFMFAKGLSSPLAPKVLAHIGQRALVIVAIRKGMVTFPLREGQHCGIILRKFLAQSNPF